MGPGGLFELTRATRTARWRYGPLAVLAAALCGFAATPAGAQPLHTLTGLPTPPAWASGRHIHFDPTFGQGSGSAFGPAPSGGPRNASSPGSGSGVLLFHPNGDGVEHSPALHVVFWGKNWTGTNDLGSNTNCGTASAPQDCTPQTLQAQLTTFYNNVSGSSFQNVLTQYYDQTGYISPTVAVTYADDYTLAAPTNVTDAAIEAEAAAEASANHWATTINDQYIVLPAPGTAYRTANANAFTATTSAGSATLTNVSSFANVIVGDALTGPGLNKSVVLSVSPSAHTVTLDTNANANGTATPISVNPFSPSGGFTADATVGSNVLTNVHTPSGSGTPWEYYGAVLGSEGPQIFSSQLGAYVTSVDNTNHTVTISTAAVATATGVDVANGGGFCAYHSVDNSVSPDRVYAVIPYPGDAPFPGTGYGGFCGVPYNTSATQTAAHEYAEAATNPIAAFGADWYSANLEEVADLCGGTDALVQPLGNIQALWDNAGNQCSFSETSQWGAHPPVVQSLDTTSGPSAGGGTVTITGYNLINPTSVKFGGQPATNLVVNTPDSLTVTAPAGTGTVDVTAANQYGTSTTSTADQFSYGPPSVTGLNPLEGAVAGGTSVTVNGVGFNGATAVHFGAALGTNLHVVSNTQLTVTAPAGADSTDYVDVTVTGQGGTSSVGTADQYIYGPVVTGMTPTSGPVTGGTTVTLTGTGFLADGGVSSVLIAHGFELVTPQSVTDTSLTFVMPPVAAGPTSISLLTNGDPPNQAQSSVSTGPTRFTVTPPQVSGVSTAGTIFAEGGIAGGTTVTISGSGLTGATDVRFGSAHAQFQVNSDSTITATSPPGSDSTGYVDVTVVTPNGTTAVTPNDQFAYGPTVTGLSPTSGPVTGGNTVTVTGTGFTSDGGILNIFLASSGDQNVPFTVNSDTQLTLTMPPSWRGRLSTAGLGFGLTGVNGQAGTGFAFVTTQTYTYTAVVPAVTSVSTPGTSYAVGGIAGGTTVTVNGSGFTQGATVLFGTAAGTNVNVISSTQLTVTSPAGSDSTGYVDITVRTPSGTSAVSAADQFVYGATITSISPSSGSKNGGTIVTVTGTGFHADGGIAAVYTAVGIRNVPFTINSDTQMTLTMPPNGRTGSTALLFVPTGVSGQQNTGAPAAGPSFTYQ